jgi:hypothetical protein
LKCGAGEGWKRSVGLNMSEMKKYSLESRSRGIPYKKYVNKRRTVAFSDSSDRPKLEDTTNPTTHGDWRLYVQNWEAPDDGRKSARNM